MVEPIDTEAVRARLRDQTAVVKAGERGFNELQADAFNAGYYLERTILIGLDLCNALDAARDAPRALRVELKHTKAALAGTQDMLRSARTREAALREAMEEAVEVLGDHLWPPYEIREAGRGSRRILLDALSRVEQPVNPHDNAPFEISWDESERVEQS